MSEVVETVLDLSEDGVYSSTDADDHQALLFNAVTNSLQSSDATSTMQSTYCWRWYMLAVVTVLNLSNGMVSLCLHTRDKYKLVKV